MKEAEHLLYVGKSPLEQPKNVSTCTFCGRTLSQSIFSAFSPIGVETEAAICYHCIKKYSLAARFCENHAIYLQDKPDYESLKQKLLRRLFFEPENIREQEIIIEVCLRVLKRASAILGGAIDICPKTGISLVNRIRIALIGKNTKRYSYLFEILCSDLGLCFLLSNTRDVASGKAFQDMTNNLTREAGWSQNGIIFCQNGYVDPLSLSTVVFACENENEIPKEKLLTIDLIRL